MIRRKKEKTKESCRIESADARPSCGLCGKVGKLTKTSCCDQWICDDAGQYVLFSYARNSCYRNHDRYSLCSYHYNEGHKGDWKECQECREDFETEMYVWYGTNEYNFEKLANPPKHEPTKCAKCKKIIKLSEDEHSLTAEGQYLCGECTSFELYNKKND